jgi:hypothetical protein
MIDKKRHSRVSLVHLALVVVLEVVEVLDRVVDVVMGAGAVMGAVVVVADVIIATVVVVAAVVVLLSTFLSATATTFGYFFLQKLWTGAQYLSGASLAYISALQTSDDLKPRMQGTRAKAPMSSRQRRMTEKSALPPVAL